MAKPIETSQGGVNQERKLEEIPMDQRERMENSWKALEDLIPKGEIPEGVTISKVEFNGEEERKKKVDEMHEFFLKAFEGEEMVSKMQLDIGMRHGIVDYYEAKDDKGEIISALSSQRVETTNEFGEQELSMVVWYVANDPNYEGKSVVKELGAAALNGFLEQAKDELKPVRAILGEAEDEGKKAMKKKKGETEEQFEERQEEAIKTALRREKLFNRYADMKRVYGVDKGGERFEVLYEAPPEDDSPKGAPANFMIRQIDGRNSISPTEYMNLVKGIHGQYSRPEYFTPEAIADEEEVPVEEVTEEKAAEARDWYLGVIQKIQKKIEKSLKPAKGDLMLMSERERRGAE